MPPGKSSPRPARSAARSPCSTAPHPGPTARSGCSVSCARRSRSTEWHWGWAMSRELELIPRLLAVRDGRAQRRATHLQYALAADALVVCAIALAGEDTTIHAVAWGRV